MQQICDGMWAQTQPSPKGRSFLQFHPPGASLSVGIQTALWATHLSPVTPQLQTTAICCCCCQFSTSQDVPCLYTWIIQSRSASTHTHCSPWPHCVSNTPDEEICHHGLMHSDFQPNSLWPVCVTPSSLFHQPLPGAQVFLDVDKVFWKSSEKPLILKTFLVGMEAAASPLIINHRACVSAARGRRNMISYVVFALLT